MFFDADNVKIEIVFYYPTEDRSAALRRFRAGELHMNQDFPADQMDWLRENLPVETRIAPYLGIYYYAVNLMNAPLDQTAIRQALSMAIDRETIVDYVMRDRRGRGIQLCPAGRGKLWRSRPKRLGGAADGGTDNHRAGIVGTSWVWR